MEGCKSGNNEVFQEDEATVWTTEFYPLDVWKSGAAGTGAAGWVSVLSSTLQHPALSSSCLTHPLGWNLDLYRIPLPKFPLPTGKLPGN